MAIPKDPDTIINNVSIVGNGAATSDYVDLTSAIDFCVGVTLTFNANTTGDVRIDMYADPTGANPDFAIGANDEVIDTYTIAYKAGSTVNTTIPLHKFPKYVKIKATNLSPTYGVTAFTMTAQVQKG